MNIEIQKFAKSTGFAITLVVMTCGGQAVSAEERAAPKRNIFAAPYELIPDHPQCSGLGKTAFKVAFRAEDVRFRVRNNEAELDAVFASDGEIVGTQCYRTERKGTEAIRTEITCPRDGSGLRSRALEIKRKILKLNISENIVADFAGEFSACMTMSGYKILDASWALDFSSPQKQITRVTHQELNDGVQIEIVHPSGPQIWWDRDVSTPGAILKMTCQPVDLREGSTGDTTVSLIASLGLSERVISDCVKKDANCFSRTVPEMKSWFVRSLRNSTRCPRP